MDLPKLWQPELVSFDRDCWKVSGEARRQEETMLLITLQDQTNAGHSSKRVSILGVRSLATCEDTARKKSSCSLHRFHMN